MNQTKKARKALVLEAFDTLFNQRNYSGRPTTSSTAPTSRRAAMVCSIWSRLSPRRCATSPA
ncbi:hypothetical protein [Paraburkholderia sp. GAS334]|uniref:hypothetical protein n=1 Tax=Paraburkholderia sp. GAS334 TaxID=3035131 RepID=UPI003D1F55A8